MGFPIKTGLDVLLMSRQKVPMKNADMIKHFEELVDELLKDDPDEHRVKMLMEKLSLDYQMDSVNRITTVLEKMNKLVFESQTKKGEHDLQ